MFTQFFGSYLLNKKIVSPANLRVALEKKDTTRAGSIVGSDAGASD